MKTHRVHAFTLIELLVVIAIIGILASMLLPALRGAQVRARTVSCTNSVKQAAVAVFAYADDSDRFFPTHFDGTGNSMGQAWEIYNLPGTQYATDLREVMRPYLGVAGMFHAFTKANLATANTGSYVSGEISFLFGKYGPHWSDTGPRSWFRMVQIPAHPSNYWMYQTFPTRLEANCPQAPLVACGPVFNWLGYDVYSWPIDLAWPPPVADLDVRWASNSAWNLLLAYHGRPCAANTGRFDGSVETIWEANLRGNFRKASHGAWSTYFH